jgi:DNA-directed RNA polymerase specialized sigma24 family protein
VPEASAQVARCGQFDRTVGVRVVPSAAEQRKVLVLRDVQHYSGSEVAEALGLSTAAMKSRLHRARQALREALDA